MRGKEGRNIYTNFEQYKFKSYQLLGLMRADMSQFKHLWKLENTLDAIITDPPYGIRESTKKIGAKSRRKNVEIPEDYKSTHIPQRVSYPKEVLLQDLLDFAAKALKLGGRLVFWFPTTPLYVVLPFIHL